MRRLMSPMSVPMHTKLPSASTLLLPRTLQNLIPSSGRSCCCSETAPQAHREPSTHAFTSKQSCLFSLSFNHTSARISPSHLSICCSFSSYVVEDEDSPATGIINSKLRKKSGKVKSVYVCQNCGESFDQWWGYCSSCKMQGTLKRFSQGVYDEKGGGGAGVRAVEKTSENTSTVETFPDRNGTMQRRSWLRAGSTLGPQRLSDVSRGTSATHWRLPLVGSTGTEISRVLGGGLVPGSLILVGGDPGVGKSTLLLQLSSMLAEGCEFYKPAPVLYVSGEESEEQICSRADRVKISAPELFLYSATDLESILNSIQQLKPRAVVIDSIQTVYLPEATGSAGSVVQVKECATALLRIAKRTSVSIFLVGHVSRSGDLAGPRVLEHIVDVVLYLEGENRFSHRILRVVKNRFGSTDEVGVFEMIENGLVAVENPSQLFVNQRGEEIHGSVSGAIAVNMEGSRAFLVEIQALCTATSSQVIKHMANGLEPQRLHLILAVLSKVVSNVKVHNQNVYINVVGGLQVKEPAVDLAVAVAICSSYFDKEIPADMAFIGEIGLGGEIRPVRQLEKRVLEVSKLGFKKCVMPKLSEKAMKACTVDDLTLIPCSTISEVINNVVLGMFSKSAMLVSFEYDAVSAEG